MSLGRFDDFFVMTDRCEALRPEDEFVYDGEEDDISAVFLPRKKTIPDIDNQTLIDATTNSLRAIESMKILAKIERLILELKCRYSFCTAYKQIITFVLPLLRYEAVAARLRQRQEEVSRKQPTFPVAVFVPPPPPPEYKISITPDDEAELEKLKKTIGEICSSVERKKKQIAPSLKKELEQLEDLAKTWMRPDLCDCIKRAIESINSLLAVVRVYHGTINRLFDYIEVLDLAETNPVDATEQFMNVVNGCPFLVMKGKPAPVVKVVSEDDDISALKERIKELHAICEGYRRINESLQRGNDELRHAALEMIQSLERDVQILTSTLQSHGLGVLLDDDEIEVLHKATKK